MKLVITFLVSWPRKIPDWKFKEGPSDFSNICSSSGTFTYLHCVTPEGSNKKSDQEVPKNLTVKHDDSISRAECDECVGVTVDDCCCAPHTSIQNGFHRINMTSHNRKAWLTLSGDEVWKCSKQVLVGGRRDRREGSRFHACRSTVKSSIVLQD